MKMILCQVNIGTRGKSLVIKKEKSMLLGKFCCYLKSMRAIKNPKKVCFSAALLISRPCFVCIFVQTSRVPVPDVIKLKKSLFRETFFKNN